jgi:endo-1,4-beta-xylanase
MLRHSYGFGTFLESRMILDSSDRGRRYRQWNLKMFNRCTTPIYWADWGWANPKHRREMLACARWAARQNLPTRGHVIIYPGWQFLPGAVRRLQEDPAALRSALARHVADVVRQTRDLNFREYDVTNELRHLTESHSLLGRDVVAQWFRIAREHAAPTVAMGINENGILTHGGFTRAQQDNYLAWIRTLDQAGQAPDVVGIQGHFAGAPTAPSRVVEILDRFGKTGIPIQITEFDFDTRDEQGQAEYLRDFLTAVFSHPATEAFTVWGFWEGRMWRPRGAMLREDWTLKPNGEVWMDLVKGRWWTDEAGQTDPQGRWSLRGFCGSYEVTVTHKGRSQNVQLQLETDGALERVVLSDKSSPEDTSE